MMHYKSWCSQPLSMSCNQVWFCFLIGLTVVLASMRVLAGYVVERQVISYYPDGDKVDIVTEYYTSIVQQAMSKTVVGTSVLIADDKKGRYQSGDTQLQIYTVKEIGESFKWPGDDVSQTYSQTNVSVRAVSEDEEILGYKVTKYEVWVAGELKEELWLSAELGEKMKKEIDYKLALKVWEAARKGTWRENAVYVNMSQNEGFSLKTIWHNDHGVLKTVDLVTKIDIKDFSESTFKFPESFEEVDEEEMTRRIDARDRELLLKTRRERERQEAKPEGHKKSSGDELLK